MTTTLAILGALTGIIGAALISYAPSMERHYGSPWEGRDIIGACAFSANLYWCVSNACWLAYGCITGQWAIIAQSVAFGLLALRGVSAWRGGQ